MAATIKRKNKRARNADASTNSIQSKAKIDPLVQHLGIGIDTGRYGHHVSFLREDKQQAALPMTVMEKAVDYQKLKTRLE